MLVLRKGDDGVDLMGGCHTLAENVCLSTVHTIIDRDLNEIHSTLSLTLVMCDYRGLVLNCGCFKEQLEFIQGSRQMNGNLVSRDMPRKISWRAWRTYGLAF